LVWGWRSWNCQPCMVCQGLVFWKTRIKSSLSAIWGKVPGLHHRHDAGAACPPRSFRVDTAEHRRWQTPGADAQILRASARSPRETLVVCLVKRCGLTCSHYTLSPIMSHVIAGGSPRDLQDSRRDVRAEGDATEPLSKGGRVQRCRQSPPLAASSRETRPPTPLWSLQSREAHVGFQGRNWSSLS